jgi:hypothetical protein
MMRGELSRYWRVLELTVEAEIEAEFTGDVFLASVCGMAAIEAASKLHIPDAEVSDIKREMARRSAAQKGPQPTRRVEPVIHRERRASFLELAGFFE